MSLNIETTRTKNKLLISIPTKNMKFAVRKSEMSGAQTEGISEEIKSSWWMKNGSRIKKLVAENE